MNLINLTEMPPQGYLYFEPALNWRVPKELALQGLRQVAEALQLVRAQNPQAGLDPSYEACVEAIGIYTCARLAQWPVKQRYFCGGGEVTAQALAATKAAQARSSGGCSSCGRKRK